MRNRPQILLLIKGLGVGGAERLLEASLPYLDRSRFAYKVAYMLSWKSALVPAFLEAGVPVYDLNTGIPGDPRTLVRLVRLVRREGIDLIHTHLPVAGIWGRVAGRLARVPRVVYTEHNVPQRYAPLTRALNRWTYRLNDAVIAVSDEVRREVAGYTNGRPAIVTIRNAVDVETLAATMVEPTAVRGEFGFPADAFLVTTVANLTPKKGHRFLLEAAARVLARHANARFLIVGQGPIAESLQAQAARLGLNGSVVFTGFRDDAIRLMAASDLFVLSSVYEGLPVTLLEAMALGKPSVVTLTGGIPEITDGATSVIVAPGDSQALAAAINTLREAPDLRVRMGAAAQQRARTRHGVAGMVAAIEQIYSDLLGEARA